MKKKLAIAALALLTGSLISGCAPEEVKSDGFSAYEFIYHHSDGADMKCIRMSYGVSCDWSNNP